MRRAYFIAKGGQSLLGGLVFVTYSARYYMDAIKIKNFLNNEVDVGKDYWAIFTWDIPLDCHKRICLGPRADEWIANYKRIHADESL